MMLNRKGQVQGIIMFQPFMVVELIFLGWAELPIFLIGHDVLYYFCILIILRELSVFYILYELHVPPLLCFFQGRCCRILQYFLSLFHFLCCISLVGRVFGNIHCVGSVRMLQLVSEEQAVGPSKWNNNKLTHCTCRMGFLSCY